MGNHGLLMMQANQKGLPYLFILPTSLYLFFFLALPVGRSLLLAFYDADANLAVVEPAGFSSLIVGVIPKGQEVEILDRQGKTVAPDALQDEKLLTDLWFYVEATDVGGNKAQGWVSSARIRVRETLEDGTPINGTVRRRLGSNADPLTSLFTQPDVKSEVVSRLEARAEAQILESQLLEVWFRVRGEHQGASVEGWVPSRNLQLSSEEESGRIDRGNRGEFTLRFIEKMRNDRSFWPALKSTLILLVLTVPVQVALAIGMALLIHARPKFRSIILYIFAFPLCISGLAGGVIWFSIFTQNGLLNSLLQAVQLIDEPSSWLTSGSTSWSLVAIWLAEIWQSTSLMMVIIVADLQAISEEVLEASEVFGANLWQRLRYIILPLLRPSLQVALILRTIAAIQIFEVVFALSNGAMSTLSIATRNHYYGIHNNNVASAYAVLMMLICLFMAAFYFHTLRSHHEASTAKC